MMYKGGVREGNRRDHLGVVRIKSEKKRKQTVLSHLILLHHNQTRTKQESTTRGCNKNVEQYKQQIQQDQEVTQMAIRIRHLPFLPYA